MHVDDQRLHSKLCQCHGGWDAYGAGAGGAFGALGGLLLCAVLSVADPGKTFDAGKVALGGLYVGVVVGFVCALVFMLLPDRSGSTASETRSS